MKLFDILFGCTHKNTSFPQSKRRGQRRNAAITGAYIVCLNCGKEFAYDWERMRTVPTKQASAMIPKEAKAS